MTIFDNPDFDDHEQVVFCRDEAAGLKAVIAIHNTNRGPALGGCRMWAYGSESEAVTDALRLSKGMTYKAAMADLALGGGKSVILGDSKADKTKQLMQAFGRQVGYLGGRYITAEDVGTGVADMDAIKSMTPHVVGVTGGAGDPSNSTAHGVFIGMQAAVRHRLGRNSLAGVRVALQGLGHVGWFLCEYLAEAGAELIVTDIAQDAVEKVARKFGAVAVDPGAIYDVDAEVYSPCALGATLNDETIARLKCAVVAGSANNQLAAAHHGDALRGRGILYAPDYVINAGGLIDVARFALNYGLDEGRKKLFRIDDTLVEIFDRAERDGLPTNDVADRIAEERFRKPS